MTLCSVFFYSSCSLHKLQAPSWGGGRKGCQPVPEVLLSCDSYLFIPNGIGSIAVEPMPIFVGKLSYQWCAINGFLCNEWMGHVGRSQSIKVFRL